MNRIKTIQNGRRDTPVVDIMPKECPIKKRKIFLDEAFSITNFGAFNYLLIFTSGLMLVSVIMETCCIVFVIPVSECDLNLTSTKKGVLSAVVFFGIICSSHLWGFLADTKGRHRIIQPTLLATFISSCAASLCSNFYLLVFFRFLNGFFISAPAAAIYAYLSEFHSNAQRDRALMYSAIIYGFALPLVPGLAYIIINLGFEFNVPYLEITYKPWRLFFIIASLPGLVVFFILIFLPESPKFVLSQGNNEAVYEILHQMNRMNNGKKVQIEHFEIINDEEAPDNSQNPSQSNENVFSFFKSIWIQTVPLFKPPYLLSSVLTCTVQFGILATTNGFYMFFADILNKMASNLNDFTTPRVPMCGTINMKSINETLNSTCITKLEPEILEQGIILEISYAVGFIIISLLINRIGKFPILFIILAGSGAGGIMCMISDIPLVQIYSFIVLMCAGMATNVANAVTVEIFPTSVRGMALSISQMFGRVGCVTGAIIAALLLENSCEVVFYLSGSSLIVIAVLTSFIPNIHKKVIDPPVRLPRQSRPSIISLRC